MNRSEQHFFIIVIQYIHGSVCLHCRIRRSRMELKHPCVFTQASDAFVQTWSLLYNTSQSGSFDKSVFRDPRYANSAHIVGLKRGEQHDMFRITVIWSGQCGSFPNKQQLILKWPALLPLFSGLAPELRYKSEPVRFTAEVSTGHFNVDMDTVLWRVVLYEVHTGSFIFSSLLPVSVVESFKKWQWKWKVEWN